MVSYLLNAAPESRTVLTFLSDPIIIVALAILVVGIVLTLLAKAITLRIGKDVNPTDYKSSKTYKTLYFIGWTIVAIGLLLLIIGTMIMVLTI